MQWDLSEGKATSSVLLRSKRPIVFWIYIVFPFFFFEKEADSFYLT